MNISDDLKRQLDAGARFDAEFGRGLSNHLPMALVALESLGADAARRRDFEARYAQRLRPARARADWPVGDAWTSRLGDRAAWPVYRDLFAQWIVHEGARDMLAQVLPALMPGCAASAFHGLIRTACAVRVGHLGELADGLAHWASSHLPLGDLPPAGGAETEPAMLLRRLSAGRSRAPLIAGRMRDAARGGAVNRTIASLAIDERTAGRLARAAAQAYAATGNFTALHLVTGTHAMRLVVRFVDDPLAAWRWYWQAFAHGVVAARLEPRAPVAARPWPELVAAAIACDDEHVIKLVDSAREEHRHHGAADEGDDTDVWQHAAARAVGPKPRSGLQDC